MKQRIIVLLVCVCLLFSAPLARAQFGLGITVFDPSVYAEAVAEVSNLVQQYNQLVQTYQTITNQYNQMLWMAKTLPGNLANFQAIPTPWFLSSATNTYGTTAGWIGAINTGSNVPGGYQSATDPLPAYAAALGNIPADQLGRLKNHYATIELTDGANQNGMQTIGTLRFNAPQVEAAIQNLEDVSLNSDPDYNTEIGVLNKINAADVIALRNSQDTNKLLTTLAEQQFIEAKRQRDSEADAINNHVAFMASEQGYLASQKANASDAMLNFRMP
jgi:conjugal transfer/entry exclusion protein